MLCSLQKRFNLEENTEDEKIKVVLPLPLFKNYIKYNIKYNRITWRIYINSLV